MDPTKVEAIMEWSAPMNVPEVHSFMGLAGYYRQFVEGFSKIENPITELQNNNKSLFGLKNAWKHFGGSSSY
jgi:hypothetical protein